jgi:DNA replicative helicase MCM subunit Mcm2 (Cdc46/Mcm family)
MEDDLSKIGVIPSDRKKLEHMGITTLEQLAVMSVQMLGMGPSKGKQLIQRARNILFDKNLVNIIIKDEDTIEVIVKRTDRAVRKSVLTAFDVYKTGWGTVALDIDENKLTLKRKSTGFNKVIRKAEALQEVIEAKKLEKKEKEGIFLPEDELKEFAQKRGFEGFWKNVFKEIHGNEIMKKVIVTSMFSTYAEPVHSLIIGEPGSSKTMAKEIIGEQFSNISNIGANATRSGLVCNLGTGDLGALPHADQKLILVDEFDKIPQDDIEYTYELLSNGKCTVHSAKVHQNIRSQFIMIAFANPKTKVFTKNAVNDIGLSPLLVSRCALIVRVGNIDSDERLDLFEKKFYDTGELKKKPEYYDQWMRLARRYQPEIDASDSQVKNYLKRMSDLVEKYYNTNLRRDLRMADYIRRIPMAIARASFSPIENDTLDEATLIIEDSIETWHK